MDETQSTEPRLLPPSIETKVLMRADYCFLSGLLWQTDKLGFASFCFFFFFFFIFFSRETAQQGLGIDSIECLVAGELIYFMARMKTFELINSESAL